MPASRRPPAPGAARRPGREDAPSGATPRAPRPAGARPGGAPSAPRGARTPPPRSGAVPKVAPSSSRPGAGRGAAGRSGPGRTGTPPRGTARAGTTRLPVPRLFTVRAMVFSLVLLVAFVLVYPTLGTYLQTRAEVQQLRSQRDASAAEKSDLEAELRRWDDQAYVVAQARERLSFVMPGETAFVVVDPETVPDVPAADEGPVPTAADGATRPWYASVWDSVEIAGGLDVDGTDPAATPEAPAPDAPPADAPSGDAPADPAG
ncbi:FtsB family cell division protein [Cellulomonas iranensis]|uniref:FtsB family cell division protein n=1 Tax=Cellulomonas iranensis TaxID=76862 RepID=UPI00211AF424|nr:septum formation initiator family protein [Cellulomonas iranensis]